MIRIALTGLRGQRTRLALSALAVVLGVAFLSGVQLLGNTLTDTAKGLISSTLEGTDAVVRSTSVQTSAFAEVRQTVPAGLVDAVGDVDGVAGASGVVQGFARIIGATGEPVDSGLIPTLVTNWVTDPALTQGAIIEGRAPESRQEVVLDPRTATDESIALGDTTALQGAVGLRSYTVVGIGGLGSTGEDNIGVRVVFLTSEEAMELTGAEGQFAFLTLRAEPDIDQQVLTDRVNATLPIGFEAVTGERYVADTQDQAGGALGLLTQLMAVFGYVGLLVGGIIIANTFSILITQRTRELALMRACGASRAQVLGGIMIEASAVGTLGSLLGLGVGFLGVVSLLALLGNVITLPDVIPTLTPLLVLGSVTVGVVTTVIASLVPGWRATRISPVAAMGEVADWPSGQMVVWVGGQFMPTEMLSHTSRRRLRSSGRPWPSRMRWRIFSSQLVPSRHGVHLPQDSRAKNRTRRRQAFTMSVSSSNTTMAPEPSMVPSLPTAPASRGTSRCSGYSHGADAPPGMNALSSLPARMPPPYSGA